MVSSPGAGLEGILGCAGLPVGGGGVGTSPGPAEPGGRRRGPGGRGGRGRLGERDLGWSRYREKRSLRLLPGPAPLDPRASAGDPQRSRADLLGEGQGTGSHGPGSGGGRELTRAQRRGGGSLELSLLQLGYVCVLWRLCCCERARLFFFF